MPYRVLIVGDSREWRTSCIRHFEKRGFSPVGCATFEEAGLLVANRHFDIAIIDFFIGDDNGGLLCDRIKSGNSGETDLIITSERQSPEIERDIRSRSPVYYFIKPCSFENLYSVALKACEWRHKKELQKQDVLEALTRSVDPGQKNKRLIPIPRIDGKLCRKTI